MGDRMRSMVAGEMRDKALRMSGGRGPKGLDIARDPEGQDGF